LSKALLEEREVLPFSVSIDLELRGSVGLEDAVSDMAAALEASAERERVSGRVLVGPHLDDLLFTCRMPDKGNVLGVDSERPAASALSRGQKRRVVVAAILAAGRLIEARLRLKPILLLDDVAAELDAEGKELMGRALADTGWQVFVTGVEDPFKIPGSAVWQIQEGTIQG
jgi:DNA replication and repair protein RecF